MKNKLRIFTTNWINVTGIFLLVYIFAVISELFDSESAAEVYVVLYIALSTGLIGMILYGWIFWIGFLLTMFLLDLLLISENNKYLRLKLLIEWIVVSSPFIYWFFKYTQWAFGVAILAFFVTQLLREKAIKKLLPP